MSISLPVDPVPNHTDPNNTASNGPAELTAETAADFHGEENLTRARASKPEEYDLVILSSFGGPEGQDDVIPFLRNVTAGRGIPDERLEEVATHYRANGGVSPINEQNRALLAALREALETRGPNLPITWANRNWEPYVKDVVQQAYNDGARKVLVLATSAYPGYSSCRQYREDYGIALEELGLTGKMQIDKVRQFWDAPGFIKSFVDGLVEGLREVKDGVAAAESAVAGNGRIRIMFCTHSVPTSAANEAGPRGVDYEGGSAYVEKHLQAARAVLAGVEAIDPALLEKVDWELVYQSRSGPPTMPWLEPDVNDALEALEGQVDGVVLVPLGFVSDHMEVKWDLDTEALDTCARLGFVATRTPTPGVHPDYVESLRTLIAERVASTAVSSDPAELEAQRETVCGSRGWFDACNPDCCLPARAKTPKPVIASYSGEDVREGARG
ncbi:ferrochelatase [Rothia aerolata]|uniref:Coproporphyrin III ferrochelatase n=1 Tax=Rothia aerolata TaxID=1812262 RepID=A0A917MRK9_9MICC|nr:ferrochelatase [Rothia aerolata]GGH59774.1 ferrochelatase [Rothia aerolata]